MLFLYLVSSQVPILTYAWAADINFLKTTLQQLKKASILNSKGVATFIYCHQKKSCSRLEPNKFIVV